MATYGAQFLTFSNNYRYFFSPQNPQYQAFLELQNVYSKRDSIFFALQADEGDAFSPKMLEAVHWLTEEGWKLPYVARADSITNYQHTAVDGDDLAVGDLVPDPATITDAERDAARAIALAEPLLLNRLISPDARTTGVLLTTIMPEKDPQEALIATNAARELRERFYEKFDGIHVALSGNVPMSNAFQEAMQRDLTTLLPGMYVLVIVLTSLLLRSFSAMGLITAIIVFSTLSAMGLAGWVGTTLTPPSATAPIVILTLAVADAVHLIAAMFTSMRRGMGRREAVIESMRINFLPVFLTSLTTAIGFLSLNASDAPPFRDLGNIVAFGVATAWILSVTLLPALMVLMPINIKARAESARATVMLSLAELVVRFRTGLLIGTLALVAAAAVYIPRIELNDQFIRWFAPSIEFRRDSDFLMANLTGVMQVEFSVKADGPQGITDPKFLKVLEDFEHWAEARPGVVHVFTIVDIMRRLNKNMNADDPAFYRVPDDRQLAAQYLLLYEMSLPYGLDLNDQLNVDKSSTRVIVSMGDVSAAEIRALKLDGDAWLQAALPETMTNSNGAGTAVMFSFISQRNIESMLYGTIAALILISLSLIIPFRSVTFGLVSMIPNLAPAILTFGAWYFLEGQVGMASAVVTASSLGIVVDATIHMLSKYLRARRLDGASPQDAVRYAFSTVGPALWLLTALLIAGFGLLAFSPFEINRALGELTAIAIFFAIFCDFLLLPPLLMAIDRPGRGKSAEPALAPAE
ncbi:MAG: MMPL family transporter [Alphaproteobacteria bacterium]|nr:MMPL family transporter [Alphaproteobacteria bacterium]